MARGKYKQVAGKNEVDNELENKKMEEKFKGTNSVDIRLECTSPE